MRQYTAALLAAADVRAERARRSLSDAREAVAAAQFEVKASRQYVSDILARAERENREDVASANLTASRALARI